MFETLGRFAGRSTGQTCPAASVCHDHQPAGLDSITSPRNAKASLQRSTPEAPPTPEKYPKRYILKRGKDTDRAAGIPGRSGCIASVLLDAPPVL
eukprot:5619488-Amphidinium_carterae.1